MPRSERVSGRRWRLAWRHRFGHPSPWKRQGGGQAGSARDAGREGGERGRVAIATQSWEGGAHLPSGRFMPESPAGRALPGRRKLALRLKPLSNCVDWEGEEAAAGAEEAKRSCSNVTDSFLFLIPTTPSSACSREDASVQSPTQLSLTLYRPQPGNQRTNSASHPPPIRSGLSHVTFYAEAARKWPFLLVCFDHDKDGSCIVR